MKHADCSLTKGFLCAQKLLGTFEKRVLHHANFISVGSVNVHLTLKKFFCVWKWIFAPVWNALRPFFPSSNKSYYFIGIKSRHKLIYMELTLCKHACKVDCEVGWSRTERKLCFPSSLTLSSSSRHRNLIWRNILEAVDQLLQGMLSLLLRCDLSTSTSLVCSMNHLPLYLLPSTKDDGDFKNTIFVGFHFTLCYQMLTWQTA